MKSVCFCRKCFGHDNILLYTDGWVYSWIDYCASLPSLLSLSLRLTGARDPLQRHCSRIHLWSHSLHLIIHKQVSTVVVAVRRFLLWIGSQSCCKLPKVLFCDYCDIIYYLCSICFMHVYVHTYMKCVQVSWPPFCSSILPNQHMALPDMSVLHAGVHLLCAAFCSSGTSHMNEKNEGLISYRPPTSPSEWIVLLLV